MPKLKTIHFCLVLLHNYGPELTKIYDMKHNGKKNVNALKMASEQRHCQLPLSELTRFKLPRFTPPRSKLAKSSHLLRDVWIFYCC